MSADPITYSQTITLNQDLLPNLFFNLKITTSDGSSYTYDIQLSERTSDYYMDRLNESYGRDALESNQVVFYYYPANKTLQINITNDIPTNTWEIIVPKTTVKQLDSKYIPITDSITSSSDEEHVPSAKAVYDAIQAGGGSGGEGGSSVTKSDINGNIKVNDEEITVYELPVATFSTLGGVKAGSYLNISQGTLSVATTSSVGLLNYAPVTSAAVYNALLNKQNTLTFNTAYDANTNKAATMSDVNKKQDALTFNSTYNASTNKVATMRDITDAFANLAVYRTGKGAPDDSVGNDGDLYYELEE